MYSFLFTLGALTHLVLGDYSLPATAVIDSGVLIGTTTALPSATATVNKFLGIPFAAPPVRFAPPQPAPSFNGTYSATAWKSSCLQQFNCKITPFGNC